MCAKLCSYLREGQYELGSEIPVLDAVEDDGQAQLDVERRVHPRLVHRSARHRRKVTEVTIVLAIDVRTGADVSKQPPTVVSTVTRSILTGMSEEGLEW